MGRETLGQVATGVVGLGVVQTLIKGLEEVHAVTRLDTNGIIEGAAQAGVDIHIAHNNWRGNQNNK